MKILCIGLGLIGGSLMLAVQGFKEHLVRVGVDVSKSVRELALQSGAVEAAYKHWDDAPVEDADVVFICLHPELTLACLAEIAPRVKSGALVTDVCGIKRKVCTLAQKVMPQHAVFVGGHPMAGKECGGFENADRKLFAGAHYLLTPLRQDVPDAMELLGRMAEHMGFADVVITTPLTHDAHIAYTSQMMHILALAICEQQLFTTSKGFEGGSFRGTTRVAALDDGLWTELFWENRDVLGEVIGELEERLAAYRQLLAQDEATPLQLRIQQAVSRKEAWNRA